MNTAVEKRTTQIPPSSTANGAAPGQPRTDTNTAEQSLAEISQCEQNLERCLQGAVGAAVVTLSVTDFQDILPTAASRGGYETAKEHLTKADLLLEKNDRVSRCETAEGQQLQVQKGGPVPFRFMVEDAHKKETYFPVGIAFKCFGTVGTAIDHKMHRSFSTAGVHIIGSNLYFNYNYSDGLTVGYEFFLIIQRESDGLVGIIDPGIKNAN
jgi:hypothetical protein